MTAYILDTETHHIINPHATEVAYIQVGFGEDNLLSYLDEKAYEQRFNPLAKISLGSQSITRIFDEDVADKPPHTSFELPQNCQFLIGHNIDFDCDVLINAECDISHVQRICTLALSRHFYPDLDSHTLGAMLCYLHPNIAKKNLKHAHGAKYDIWFTFLVLKSLCEKFQINNLQSLYDISEQARKPTIMTFGKYKGVAIVDLPKDYVEWLLKQSDLDPYLKLALDER